jgi:hypothetical protein
VVSIVISSVIAVAGAIVAPLAGVQRQTAAISVPLAQGNSTLGEQKLGEASAAQSGAITYLVNPAPLAWLIGGLILGAGLGILIRNNGMLGSPLSIEVRQWTEQGIATPEAVQRLLQARYPYSPYVQQPAWLMTGDSTEISKTLNAEIDMWATHGLSKEEVARRLLSIKYPDAAMASPAAASASVRGAPTNTIALGTVLFEADATECQRLRSATNDELALHMRISQNQLLQVLAVVVEDPAKLREITEIFCKSE